MFALLQRIFEMVLGIAPGEKLQAIFEAILGFFAK